MVAALNTLTRVGVGISPWLVIAGLLYVGLFVKPEPVGSTVIPTAIEARDRFYGLATPESNILWAVAADGKIVRSDDAGKSWQVQDSGTNVHLQDIAAWDSNKAVIVGNSGVAMYTENGGQSWWQADAPRNDVVNKLLDVKTYANGEAWAVGSFGTILVSRDYGKTWQYALEPDDYILNEITKRADGSLLTVGEFGTILLSTDGGQNWQNIRSGIESSLMTVDFADNQNGIAAGLDGVLLQTRDGGQTWQRIRNQFKGLTEAKAAPGIANSGGWQDVTTEHIFTLRWHPQKSRWYGAGSKGLWLEADAEGNQWQSGRLAPKDLSWHTATVLTDEGVIYVGRNIGRWDGTNWQVYTSR